jgi:peptidoglycan/xylan/chitin deacetylase (PgdA/CDA1 family)
MRYLNAAGYRPITLRDLAERLKGNSALDPKTAVLTFDDGFKNFYTEAAPVLDEFGFRATVFLVTDCCGGHNDWAGNPADFPRSELLSWKEIRELDVRGFEFGSHTRTHKDLTKLSSTEVESEMLGSKEAISNALGRETSTFAYPFGRANAVCQRSARENFTASCSTNLGKVVPKCDLSMLERIDSYYLAKPRVLKRLNTSTFDRYMRFRQCLRTARALMMPA